MNVQITKNFNLNEFHCKDGTKIPEIYMINVIELMQNLQKLRDKIDCPIHVNSGYRSPDYNEKIGGVGSSQHLFAKAADITCRDYSPNEIASIIETMIAADELRQGGIGRYKGFTHYDIRGTRARWTG